MMGWMVKEEKESGLSSMFNGAASGFFVGAAISVATFFIFGYLDNFVFDALFIPDLHNADNPIAQALIGFMQDNFSWMHDISGLTGETGILQWDYFQNMLEPYMPASGEAIASTFSEGLSTDDLMGMIDGL